MDSITPALQGKACVDELQRNKKPQLAQGKGQESFTKEISGKVYSNEQYLPVVLFIMLYKVVLAFESMDEILKCDHSNKSYWATLILSRERLSLP